MPPSKAALAKIHIAKKALGLTDEVYRDMLYLHFKVESAAQLDERQATVLLNKFRAKGWQAKSRPAKPSKSSPVYADGQRRKVLALWITLADAGVVRNRSDLALQAYVKRQIGVDNLKWCDSGQLNRLIESLKQWAAREDVDVEYR